MVLSRLPSRVFIIAVVATALVATVLALAPGSITRANAQAGVTPFVCDGTPYIMQDNRMNEILPHPVNPGEFIFSDVSVEPKYGNALGYDPTTNLISGIVKENGKWVVETYDGTFAEVNSQVLFAAPGSPAFPTGGTIYAGTVLGDGRYLIGTWRININGSQDNLWSVDPATGEATFIGPTARQGDFAYNPLDGYLYHAVGANLWRIDPLTGVTSSIGPIAGMTGSGFGSSYFDAQGNLYVHDNKNAAGDGELWKITGISSGGPYAATSVAVTPSVSGADAASCVGELDLVKDVVDAAGAPVALSDRVYGPGDVVYYEFTIVNNALPTGPINLTLCDTLPADGRTYTGNVTVAGGTPIAFTTPFGAGSTNFCAAVQAPSSLWTDPASPGSSPVKVTFEVQLPADMAPGEHANQGFLDAPGGKVLSDDPGDTSDPEDPTTIEVTGEITVGKKVSAHPDGNDTDAFTMTITCVDADGDGFDVAATSIVDSAGDPWTGATTNSFPIRSGEKVRIVDLPYKASCTVTETVPAAYAASVAGSDGVATANSATQVIDQPPSKEQINFTNLTGEFELVKVTQTPKGDPPADLDMTGDFVISVTCSLDGDVVLAPTEYTVSADTVTASGAEGSSTYPDLPLLPVGSTCVATEVVPDGWTLLSDKEVKFTIGEKPTTVKFGNTRLLTSLTIDKLIEGLPPGADAADFSFDVTVECSGGFVDDPAKLGPFKVAVGSPIVIDDLPVGTVCVVAEEPTVEFSPSYDPAGGKIELNGKKNLVTITNTTGTFIVEKNTTVPTDTYPIDPTGTFTFDIVCTNDGKEIYNESHTFAASTLTPTGATGGITYDELPLLPPGTTCVVAEQTPPSGWQLDSAPKVEITIPADGVRPTATFENSRKLVDVTVEKTVEGAPPGVDLGDVAFDVTMTCTGPFTGPVEVTGEVTGNTDLVFADLPAGATCVVTEAAADGYATTVSPAGGKIEVNAKEKPVVEFTNTTSWFTLSKKTTVSSDHPVENDATFTIRVICKNDGAEVFDKEIELTTVDGSVTVAPPDLPLFEPGTECEFTETVPANWTVDTNPQTLVTGKNTEVVFGNTRDLADLTVNKEVVGLPAGVKPESFSFVVDVSCTGGFEAGADPYVIEDLTIVPGTPLVIEDLPIGTVCVVVEDPATGFATSYSPAGGKVEVTEKGAKATVTNSTGTIQISKATKTPGALPIEEDATFTFDVDCKDGAGTSVWSGTVSTTTTDGTGQIGYPDLPLLPTGTFCVVTETPIPANWSITDPDQEVTVSKGGPAIAAFTNVRDVASLDISKSIVGLPAGASASDFSFTVDITCTGGFAPGDDPWTMTDVPIDVDTDVTIDNLPVGATCTVIEDNDPAWTPLYNPSSGKVTIEETGGDVAIVNSTGELIVAKYTVVDSEHPIDPTGEFDFKIVCTGPKGDEVYNAMHTLSASELTATGATGGIRYDDLPLLAGGTTCVITEQTPPTGWTLTSGNDIKVTISSKGGNTAEFTNERDLGDVDVTKKIAGLPKGADASTFSFDITLVCNHDDLPTDYKVGPLAIGDGGTVSVDGLPSGATCVVSESADAQFTATYNPTDATVEVGADKTATVDITNSTGTIAINKLTTSAGPAPADLAGTFTFQVTCDNGYSALHTVTTDATGNGVTEYPTLPLVAAGTTCTVVEQGPPDGWSLASAGTVKDEVVTSGPTTYAFSNSRDLANLTVTKTLDGVPSEVDLDGVEFTINIECEGDFDPSPWLITDQTVSADSPYVLTGVPTGSTCTVVEEPDIRFEASYVPALPTAPDEGFAVIDDDGGTVAITNSTGELIVAKYTTFTSDHPIDPVDTFTFDISCSKDGSSVYVGEHTFSADTVTATGAMGGIRYSELPLMPNGTVCTVTEQGPSAEWMLTTANPVTVTVDSDDPATAEFTNDRITGDLTITKTIEGLPAGFENSLDAEIFTVDITCTGELDPSPYVIADQTLSVNSPLVIEDLPTNSTCSVVEDYDPRFTPLYDPATVTIAKKGSEIGITNVTGELIVAKYTLISSEHPIDPNGDFDFRIVCTNPGGAVVFDQVETVTVSTATATGAMGGIRYDDLPLFADGTTCVVTEQTPPSGWTLDTAESVEITIDADAPKTAEFTNSRDLGDVDITKTVTGLPADADPADYSFSLTLTCNDDDLPTDYAVGPETVQHGDTWTVVDLPTGADCTVTEASDPGFAASFTPATATVSITDEEVSAVAVTNSTGTLLIAKKTQADSELGVDLADTFTFAVVCDNGYSGTHTVTTDAAGVGQTTWPSVPLMAADTECSVTEQAPPSGWTLSTESPLTTTVIEGGPSTASFTNTRDVAKLTVSKVLDGIPSDADFDDYEFLVDIVCVGDFASSPLTLADQPITANEPLVVPGVPTDATCAIVEQPDLGFSPSYAPADPDDSTTGLVTVPSAGAAVTVTNSTGELIVAKYTTVPADHPVDPNGTFTFDITCTNPDDGSTVYTGTHTFSTDTLTPTGAMGGIRYTELPLMAAGTVCSIAEQTPTDPWTLVSASPVSVTIDPDAPATATFTNDRDTTTLTITKEITGLPKGFEGSLDNEPFTVDITCTGPFTPSPYVIEDQIVRVSADLEIENLPVGAVCSVAEDADPRFTPTIDPAVTLTAKGNTVDIVNATGELIVLKETVVDSAHPISLFETFEFRIACTSPKGEVYNEVHEVDVIATTATGAVGGIRYDELPLFADSSTCTITELATPTGWTLETAAAVNLVIDNEAPVTAEFTNRRDVGDLEITKTIAGLPADADPTSYAFTVDVVCNGGGLPLDYAPGPYLFSTATPITIEDLPTGANCVVSERTAPGFTPSYAPVDGQATIADEPVDVAITNSTGVFSIAKTTTAPDGVRLDDSFEFEVTCTNGYEATHEITTSATGVGSEVWPAVPLLPPGTECEISEIGPDAEWTLTTESPITVTIDATGVAAEAPFTNARKTSNLTINKTIEGLPDALTAADYSFDITVTCTGDFVESPLLVEQAIVPGTPLTIPDLPTNAECEVVEAPDDRFAISYAPSEGATEIGTGINAVAITNSTATFDISKSTNVDSIWSVDPDATFTFSVICRNGVGDTIWSNPAVTITTNDGFGTAAHPTLPILAEGTVCEVEEVSLPTHWSTADPDETLILSSDETKIATFTNVRAVADLTISKTIAGLPEGADDEDFTFTVDITCVGDFEGGELLVLEDQSITVTGDIVVENLPVGATCTFTENNDTGFTPTYTPASEGAGQVDVGTDGAAGAIVNSTGEVIVLKQTLVESEHPINPMADFDFLVTCTAPGTGNEVYSATHTINVDVATATGAVGELRYDELPILADGTNCSASEVAIPTGWTADTESPQTVTVETDALNTMEFVNSRDLGDVRITKTVTGLPEGADASDYEFAITVVCNGGGLPTNYEPGSYTIADEGEILIEDLPTEANCVVTETADDRFAAEYAPSDAVAAPLHDEIVDVDITNRTGTLDLSKSAVADTESPVDLIANFNFTISCDNGYSGNHTLTTNPAGEATLVWPALPLMAAGTECVVSEVDLPTGWTVTSEAEVTVVIEEGGPNTAAFVNERALASLTITKILEGVPSGENLDDTTFGVDVVCTGDFPGGSLSLPSKEVSVTSPLVIDGLPSGAVCEFVELPDARFTVTYDSADPEDPAQGLAAIGDEGGAGAITNSTGELIVAKYTTFTSTHPIDPLATFTFDIRCTNGDTIVFADELDLIVDLTTAGGGFGGIGYDELPLMPDGTECTVTEEDPGDGWSLQGAESITVTIDADDPATAEFINDRDTADLRITKLLDGVPVDAAGSLDEVAFLVDVTCTGDFVDGLYKLTALEVSVANPLVVTDLPTNAECSVLEYPDPGFTPSYSPTTTVTMSEDGAAVEITNRTGELIVAKFTEVADTHGIDPVDTFTFAIECIGPDGETVVDETRELMTDTLTATGAMGGIGYDELPLLAAGTTCTVSETDVPEGWTLSTDEVVELVIDPEAAATAAFVNSRDVGVVRIDKLLEGVPESWDLTAEMFEVELTCTGDFTNAPLVLSGLQVNAADDLVIEDLPTGAECTAVETADPRFATSYSPANGATTVADGEVLIAITNATTSIEIAKTTTVDSAWPVEDDGEFDFEVRCSDAEGTFLFDETITIATSDGSGTWASPETPLLPPGTECSVTEVGFDSTAWSPATEEAVTATTNTDAPVSFDLVNDRNVAPLTVAKFLKGVPPGALEDEVFLVDVECEGGFAFSPYVFEDQPVSASGWLTIDGLPVGTTCTVTEQNDDRFAASYAPDGGTALIDLDGAQVNVTNTAGGLLISKQVTVDSEHPVDLSGVFTFEVSCDNGYAGIHTISTSAIATGGSASTSSEATPSLPLLPNGATCTVVEVDVDSAWTLTSAAVVEVEISGDDAVIAEFTNDRRTDEITIVKDLVGLPAGATAPDFDITAVCTGAFIESPYIIDGLTITPGAPATISGLPTGASCEIREMSSPEWAAAYSSPNETGTAAIASPGDTVVVTNTTAQFIIEKHTSIASTYPVSPEGLFTFDISCTAGGVVVYEATHSIQTAASSATTGFGGLSYDELPSLAPGTSCTIAETDLSPGWALDSAASVSITLDATQTATAKFDNRRIVDDLIVEKVMTDDVLTDQKFGIDVTCTGDFLGGTLELANLEVSQDEPLAITGLPYGATCEVTEQPQTNFTTAYEPANASAVIGQDDGVTVLNTIDPPPTGPGGEVVAPTLPPPTTPAPVPTPPTPPPTPQPVPVEPTTPAPEPEFNPPDEGGGDQLPTVPAQPGVSPTVELPVPPSPPQLAFQPAPAVPVPAVPTIPAPVGVPAFNPPATPPPAVSVPPTTPVVKREPLAITGRESTDIALLGALLFVMGGALVITSRRRFDREEI